MQSLVNMRERQLRETRYKLDKKIQEDLMDTDRGPSKFAGRPGKF
jgi:hypothetical protein